MRADMRLRELSLRQDPDLRQELAALARGCDFVLPSRFKKRLKAFQQVPGGRPCVCGGGSLLALPGPCEVGAWGAHTGGACLSLWGARCALRPGEFAPESSLEEHSLQSPFLECPRLLPPVHGTEQWGGRGSAEPGRAGELDLRKHWAFPVSPPAECRGFCGTPWRAWAGVRSVGRCPSRPHCVWHWSLTGPA